MGLNQIYKVVWSKTKGCYVVVSELAKRVGRNKTKAVVVATAAMAMVVAPVMVGTNTVDAAIAIGSTTDNTFEKGTANAKDGASIAIGSDVDASVGDRVIAIGNNTKSQGGRNTVIGAFATAGYDGSDKLTGGNKRSVGQSIAIGAGSNYKEGARAYGDQAIAIGSNTIAYGNSSIAIGNDDVDRAVTVQTTYTNSEGNKVTGTIGEAYANLTGKDLKNDGGRWKDAYAGEAAVTIGVKSEANDISVALGTGAKAKAVNALALGTGATATFDNSVALGGGSTTDKEGTKQTSVTVNGHTYNWSGGSTTGKGDVVSIGKAGYERQLKNVAAGEVSETSTDGINGSQLYGILNNMTVDPTFLYAGDDADAGEVTGADADAKKADADKKKIVSRSMKDSRLNLLGGADKTKLSEGNIGVNYENGNTLTFKLAKDLKGLDSTTVGGIVTNADGINMNNKPITNVAGNLPGAKKDTEAPTTTGVGPTEEDAKKIANNAATVGDVLNAGWNLQNNGDAKDLVKPYDTVNFINGEGTTAVVETTDNKVSTVKFDVKLGTGLKKDDKGNITVDAGDITNESGAPKVADTDKDKVATAGNVAKAINNSYWIASAEKDGKTIGADDNVKPSTKVTFDAGKNIEIDHSTPNKFTFKTVDNPEFKTLDLNDGAGNKVNLAPTADGLKVGKGDNNEPANITNVAGNLPGAKKDTETPTTTGVAPTEEDAKKIANNAATVGDVLNAGWNLKNNGEARDFVKPYDTVNFVDGANTTAVVTTSKDGKSSDVTYNVTGLPITYTDKDGKPVSKVGDNFYPVNEKGQPITSDGKPAVGTNDKGEPIAADGTVIKPIDPKANPLKTSLVNPAPEKGKTPTTSPTQLGNVANGAETFKPADDVKLANDGKWYNAADVKPNGAPKTAEENNGKAPAPVASPLATKNKDGDILEKGNDGNWYKASDLVNGEPNPNADEQKPVAKPENADKAGLVNFANSNPSNVATVGDLQNMGFVVAAKDNGYTEQVRNANKVEFTGSKGVSVTGKTLEDGTREINVSLKEGRVTNTVIITGADGKEVKGVRGADGKIYKKDPKTGKAMKEELPIKPTDTVTNDGDAYVTGNSVATAIQKSGWEIGIGSTDKAFSAEEKTYERVNPKDKVKFANGDNTTVSMVVDAKPDRDGATVTTTYVKVDVNRDLKLDSVTTTSKDGSSTKMDGNGIKVTPADTTKKPVSLTTNGLDNGNNRITNVAPGIGDTDAVNVSQLKGVANAVAEVGNRVNRSGAQAAALAGLQTIQYDPLEPTQISAGVGHYKGSSALALGVNHYKNESTLFHVGASFNGRSSETMANASVTWKFGSRADETAVKDTFRQGPISASYTLQDKVSALEVQNSAQKDEIAELRALAATQQAQIAELFKRLNEKAQKLVYAMSLVAFLTKQDKGKPMAYSFSNGIS